MIDSYGMKNGIKRFSNLFIYHATQNDLAAITLLEWKLFGNNAWSFNMFEKYINSPIHSFPVIYYDNCLVAFGLAYLGSNTKPARIYDLGVDIQYRSYGLGKKLTNYLISKISTTGTKKVKLEVAKNNKNAINLYEQLGFSSTDVIKHYYGQNEHAIKMTLEIDNKSAILIN